MASSMWSLLASSTKILTFYHDSHNSISKMTITRRSNRRRVASAALPPPLPAVDVDGTTIVLIGSDSSPSPTPSAVGSRRRRRQGDGERLLQQLGIPTAAQELWRTDDVNTIQRDIWVGHSKMVENTLAMLWDGGSLRA